MSTFRIILSESVGGTDAQSPFRHKDVDLGEESGMFDRTRNGYSAPIIVEITGIADALNTEAGFLKTASLSEALGILDELTNAGGVRDLTLNVRIGASDEDSTYDFRREIVLDQVTGIDEALSTYDYRLKQVLDEVVGGIEGRTSYGGIISVTVEAIAGARDRIESAIPPVVPLEGIAVGTGNASVDIVWETESDWDSAVSESYINHPGDAVSMGIGLESWEYGVSDDQPIPSPWTGNDEVTDANDYGYTAREGTQILDHTSNGMTSTFPGQVGNPAPDKIEMYHIEGTNNNDAAWGLRNENGDYMIGWGTNNPGVRVDNGSLNSSVGNYDDWIHWEITFDWPNDQATVQATNISTGGSTSEVVNFANSSTGISEIGESDAYGSWTGGNTNDIFTDLVWGVYAKSSLTTATKTFQSPAQPRFTKLNYNLNGQDITLTAIGSPGTASEEQVSATLDGGSQYSLNWNNGHTDFRVKITMESPSRDTSPSLSRVALAL